MSYSIDIALNDVKIQTLSDLHLEFYENFPQPSVQGNILLLAGDIGYPQQQNYVDFLKWCGQNFLLTFIIAGNHEFYSKRVPHLEMLQILKGVTTNNVIFMEDQLCRVDCMDDSFYIYGCTLWTYPSEYIKHNMNDYKKITYLKSSEPRIRNPLDTEYVKILNQRSRQLLLEALYSVDGRLIIMTHHLPNADCLVEDRNFVGYVSGYANDIVVPDDITADIVFWIYGHSHEQRDSYINGTRFISNPVGYPGEKTGYLNGYVATLIE